MKEGIKLACLRRISVSQTYYYANAVNEDSKTYFHSFIEIKTFGLLLLNLFHNVEVKFNLLLLSM